MLSKIIRGVSLIANSFGSSFKIFILKIKYPNIRIIGETFIGKNCTIICVDGGNMVLNNAYINNGTYIFCSKDALLKINYSYIGMNSVIVSAKKIIINDNCEIAEMVVIRDQNHKHSLSNITIKDSGYDSSPIIINENVWIGAKATILKGVEIGKNTIVGAGSVVTKSIPESVVSVGVPSKIIFKKDSTK